MNICVQICIFTSILVQNISFVYMILIVVARSVVRDSNVTPTQLDTPARLGQNWPQTNADQQKMEQRNFTVSTVLGGIDIGCLICSTLLDTFGRHVH